jgi:hypothetical protein
VLFFFFKTRIVYCIVIDFQHELPDLSLMKTKDFLVSLLKLNDDDVRSPC